MEIYKPYPYQQHGTDHIIKHPASGLFLDMGLGKTVITLTAINHLMYDMYEVQKTLVIAPLRVAQHTWKAERNKWAHLRHLRISHVLGTEKERKMALYRKADIWVINRENLCWLIRYYGSVWPFDYVVVDELSSFKNPDAERFKAFRKVRPLTKRITGLTGTPMPNGLHDLWSQLYMLDRGERLGETYGGYREQFLTPGARDGARVLNYTGKTGAEQEVYRRIGDICLSMTAADYLDLPPRIDRQVPVHMTPDQLAKYEEFEQIQVMEMENGEELTAFNAQALTQKLLQFGNGAVYNADKSDYHVIHDAKLDALEDIMDASNGHPVMVFYWFKHDLQRLRERFKAWKPRELKTEQDITDWNARKIPLLFVHPASAGHGLNLQAGGNIIVWFSLTWSLELYKQANARLDRQGQTESVIIHHLITRGTMDEYVMQVLDRKEKGQNGLMEAVKAIVGKYR